MTSRQSQDLTKLLQRWSAGDRDAAEQLLALAYDELHRIAGLCFARERRDHTLQTTAVIHEAYLNLTQGKPIDWRDRSHFFRLMARVMRRVLVDHARDRSCLKRGGQAGRVTLDESGLVGADKGPDLIALDDALLDLERNDPEKAAVVELRFFGGLTIEETAEHLEVSPATIVRQWRVARAWLYRELHGRGETSGELSAIQS
jgi:RNA polymerase sigma factor (TIGR02999 family)